MTKQRTIEKNSIMRRTDVLQKQSNQFKPSSLQNMPIAKAMLNDHIPLKIGIAETSVGGPIFVGNTL